MSTPAQRRRQRADSLAKALLKDPDTAYRRIGYMLLRWHLWGVVVGFLIGWMVFG